MKIEIKNIGPFNKGELKLEDLTLIAGLNDTGKSFLNKIIYSSIKMINTDKIDLAVRPLLELIADWERRYEIYLRRNISGIHQKPNNQPSVTTMSTFGLRDLKENQDDTDDFKDINEKIINLKEILMEKDKYNFDDLVVKIQDSKKDIEDKLSSQKKNRAEKNHDFESRLIRHLILMAERFSLVSNLMAKNNLRFINQVIFNVNFEGDSVKNKYFLTEQSKISFKGQQETIDIKINTENLIKLDANDSSIFKNQIKDITYISNLSHIFSDGLKDKVSSSNDNLYTLSEFNYNFDAFEKIKKSTDLLSSNKFIKAKFSNIFEEIERDFNIHSQINYSKGTVEKDEVEFRIVNVSQGLVNLENFKLLINSGIFDENKIVIFDEPENYFHPKWQHWFIKIIFELIKATKCKVILSTHSPYIIESAYSYIEHNKKLSDLKINFGLLESKEPGKSIIKNLEDPIKILDLLIEPYNELDELKYEWYKQQV